MREVRITIVAPVALLGLLSQAHASPIRINYYRSSAICEQTSRQGLIFGLALKKSIW